MQALAALLGSVLAVPTPKECVVPLIYPLLYRVRLSFCFAPGLKLLLFLLPVVVRLALTLAA